MSWSAPAFDGFSAISSYTVTGSPGGATATVDGATTSVAVGGLANGTTYTFTVRATNFVGTGSPSAPSNAVTPATVPGAPTAVTAVQAGDRAVEVSWTPPADDGASPITGYVVTSSPGGLAVSAGAAATSVTVEDLTAGTAYTFRVAAANDLGTGAVSAPSNAVVAATVPGAPTAVTALDGDGEATVSWTAPADDGASPVTVYTLVASPGGMSLDVAATSATVSGLVNGTTYTFTVTAANAIGAGPPSAPSNPVTPATLPGAPTAVTAEVGGNAAVRVHWLPPAFDGGSAVESYRLVSNPGGVTTTVPGDALQATVDGLVLGESYTFTVAATNRRGEGPPSAASNPVTTLAVPDPPSDVTAVAGDASASLSWTAPADQGGGPVLSYRVEADPGTLEVVVAAPETTAVVPGLDNGTTYTFTVTATNAVGDSPPSQPSNAVTPQPPGVVALSALAVAPGRVTGGFTATGTVTLTAPAEAGGAAVALASSLPAAASVPASVVVAAGATSADFTITTSAVATATDVEISASLDTTTLTATLGVDPLPVGTPPTAEITAPADDSSVTAPTEVTGTALAGAFDHYVLELAPAGDGTFREIARGTDAVAGGVLGTLDPTLLLNDLYTLRLTVFDTAGGTATSTVTVQVDGSTKVGNFSLSFVDLSIPVAGLPVTVVRTYDSRDRDRGDFGVGWRLEVHTLKIRDNGTQGTGWRVAQSGGAFATYFLQPSRAHKVSLRLPGGIVEEFDFTPTPSSQALVPLRFLSPAYTARPGTTGSLRLATGTTLQVIGDQPGNVELLDLDTVADYDPRTFIYTALDGREWLIDKQDGVRRITDPNGNHLDVGPGGITHSSGVGIAFVRDGLGRITSITSPEGGVLTYAYDTAGDLVAFTDSAGAQTTFGYDDHYLTDIVDPLGRPLARNEYDADGRLVATTDADGQRTELEHDLAANREVIRDRLGNEQVFVYDDAGNLVEQTDPLGNTYHSTFDAEGRRLSWTDPLGHTTSRSYDADGNLLSETDPLGHTRSATYGASGQPLTETDERGNTTSHTYDAAGNPLTTTDPLGNTTTYTHDAAGNRLTTTDARGVVTASTYDGAGLLASETDGAGNTTTYTHDGEGNRLSEGRTRTVGGVEVTETRSFAYDAEGRVTARTDRSGAVTRSEYDAVGQIAASIDAAGHRTGLSYDAFGNLTEIRYADGTTGSFEYDAEGRKVASTDRAGRRTQYGLDAAGRVVSTVYADGASESMTYDAVGREISETDANGHTTTFEYDAAGRMTAVTDTLGHVTRFTYDAAGNKLSEADANGHTTTFEHDAAGRLTRKVFADGSDVTFTYDAAGNKLSETDPAGVTTTFAYDGANRLLEVVDGLGGVTAYGYDEAGNRTSITDARGNTTTVAYDAEGRELSRTLPLGETSWREYDAAGNLVRTRDAEGDAVVLEYDANARLVRRTLPGGSAETTSYTPTGRIASRTDPRGTTTYAYDLRDRLLRRDDPDGSFVAYTYDAAGNRLSVTTPSGTTAYTYDALEPPRLDHGAGRRRDHLRLRRGGQPVRGRAPERDASPLHLRRARPAGAPRKPALGRFGDQRLRLHARPRGQPAAGGREQRPHRRLHLRRPLPADSRGGLRGRRGERHRLHLRRGGQPPHPHRRRRHHDLLVRRRRPPAGRRRRHLRLRRRRQSPVAQRRRWHHDLRVRRPPPPDADRRRRPRGGDRLRPGRQPGGASRRRRRNVVPGGRRARAGAGPRGARRRRRPAGRLRLRSRPREPATRRRHLLLPLRRPGQRARPHRLRWCGHRHLRLRRLRRARRRRRLDAQRLPLRRRAARPQPRLLLPARPLLRRRNRPLRHRRRLPAEPLRPALAAPLRLRHRRPGEPGRSERPVRHPDRPLRGGLVQQHPVVDRADLPAGRRHLPRRPLLLRARLRDAQPGAGGDGVPAAQRGGVGGGDGYLPERSPDDPAGSLLHQDHRQEHQLRHHLHEDRPGPRQVRRRATQRAEVLAARVPPPRDP